MGQRLHKICHLLTTAEHFDQEFLLDIWVLDFSIDRIFLILKVVWERLDLASEDERLRVLVKEFPEVFSVLRVFVVLHSYHR